MMISLSYARRQIMLKLLSYTLLFLFAQNSFAAQFERINYSPEKIQAFSLNGSPLATIKLPTTASQGSSFVATSTPSLAGTTHTRYKQHINGIPVWSAEMVVHSGKNTRITGKILKDIDTKTIITAQYSADEAYAISIQFLNKKHVLILPLNIRKKEIQPYIFRKSDGKLVHAFLIDAFITAEGFISRPQIMVDAKNLSILQYWDGLQHLEVDGTGPGGNEKTGRYYYGEDFPSFKVQEENGSCTMENTNVKAIDLQHSNDDTKTEAFNYSCSSANNYENTHKEINGAYSPINDAYYFGNLIFDMYEQWYEISPLPIQLSMKVHLGTSISNAFWTGDSMLFGDGDYTTHPLVDINVSAHEVSHGFTQFNSNLIYNNESGGINEAFSDIAGEAAEFFMKDDVDWLVGGDISKTEGALRYFDDPTLDGLSIKHVDHYTPGLNVHYSSGLYNHVFYLLSNTEGWSVQTAFDIFVYANQNYWIADETFINGACGTISSAKDLSYNAIDVAIAFKDVGIICPSIIFDADQDLMDDIWEISIGFDPSSADDASEDFDNDGLTNLEEYQQGLKAKFNDSDWDGILDGDELALSTNPLNQDSDGDGMPDGFEVEYGLSPTTDDSTEDFDSDGLSNILEFTSGLNPTIRDELIPDLPLDLSSSAVSFDQELSPLWQTTGSFGWTRTTLNNQFVLASEVINHNQTAQINVSTQATAGEILSFDLKTSSESGYDYFVLKVDGISVYRLSGNNNWQTISHTFTQTGNITVSFIYQKDHIVSSGEDRVYIDNISGLTLTAKDDDSNGIADYWQSFYNITDPALDPDDDGLNNLEEFLALTSPLLADSDHDGLNDGVEVNEHKTNPLAMDTDSDGISDYIEIENNLNPLDKDDAVLDSDKDGYNNYMEALFSGQIQDANILPNSLLYIHDLFDDSATTQTWHSTQQLALPAHKQYGTWLLVNDKFQPQSIDNDMLAIASFRTLFEEGELSFDLVMDTEVSKDELIIYIDGQVEQRFSGQVDEQVLLFIKSGIHEINFVYSKDSGQSSITDSVTIDNLKFITYGDFDGDGLSNFKEIESNTNPRNKDTDGDSYDDSLDQFPNNADEWLDSDGDTFGDNQDAFPTDSKDWLDTDADGFGDNKDAFPLDATEWLDTDNDGFGNNKDALPFDVTEWLDADGDGFGDNKDVFPLDVSEWLDTDNDGFGDNKDAFPKHELEWLDTDNDGFGDNIDEHPTNPNKWKSDKEEETFLGAMNYMWLGIFIVLLSRRKRL